MTMEKFIITGGKTLRGEVSVSGAKNVALKALVAASLTDESVAIENVPNISDFAVMCEILKDLGGTVEIEDHTAKVEVRSLTNTQVSLDKAAQTRTSSMFISPLLLRRGKASIPNPGGCRIGARPIDRTIDGLRRMGADISYDSEDGYFHARLTDGKLKSTEYTFEKNTHTGTETMLLASVLAEGKTVLKNAALEPEIDELIELLNSMGAKIRRAEPRTLVIEGVEKLHGTTFQVGPDRNEIVTFAVAAIITGGEIFVKDAQNASLDHFLSELDKAGGGFEKTQEGIRFFSKGSLSPTSVQTSIHPGFMTDWQGPWAVLMTKAKGISTIHETVFENRFSYVPELRKMGAHIELFNPQLNNPREVYNFNIEDVGEKTFHAIRIFGPKKLHNAAVYISDLRAGATLVLGALAASGKSVIFGIENLDRGYERFEKRLKQLGADIQRIKE